METNALGTSDLKVSALGLGCNNLGRINTTTESFKGSQALIDAALDAGVNFFDTADVYGKTPGLGESFLGDCLHSYRQEVYIATKCGMDVGDVNGITTDRRGSKKYIIASAEASLRRLNTDYIDLYQLHTPDRATDIEESIEALNILVDSGKVRYIGHSNRAGWEIAQGYYVAKAARGAQFITSQSHYNLLDRRAELEVFPAARQFSMSVLPYFPLANGLLTGKYTPNYVPDGSRLSHSRRHYLENAQWDKIEKFLKYCADYELDPTALALAWLRDQPQIATVIAGATTPEQIQYNAQAICYVLTDQDRTTLEDIFQAPDKIALF